MPLQELFISEKAGKISIEIEESKDANHCLILAHGAGAGMDHPFMKSLGSGIHEQGNHVIRFNFPYKERGKKMPGSPKEAILALEVVTKFAVERYPNASIILSGKSYGGRMASHLVAEQPDLGVSGLIYYGFPLHAPGKNTMDRANHLTDIQIPQLFFQGTKDALANYELMQKVVDNQNQAKMIAFEQANHSFKTPKSAEQKTSEIFNELISQSAKWMVEL